MQHRQEIWPINQLLMFFGMISIILVVLKYASDLLTPFLIAIALSIILNPLFNYLERKHIPKALSLVFIIIAFMLPTVILGGYIGEEVKEFANNFHKIKQEFNISLEKMTLSLNSYGIDITQGEMKRILDKSNLGEVIKNLASQAGSQFSNIFLIFFTVAFILMESDYLYNKMIKVAQDYNRNINDMMTIIEKIKTYFLIKVKTSLITVVWIFVMLWYYEVDYFYLWAALAFFLNFIPVIGSILATVPAIAMAWISDSAMTALWVGLWYIVINTVVGNILEPRIMGKGLGLSALVIFLSMTFWGWVFGPTGMILSVPLTMATQFLFDQYRETKWIALLLSDYKKEN